MTKICYTCKVEKPTSSFTKCKNNKDGFYTYCGPCKSKRTSEYWSRAENIVRRTNYMINYRKKYELKRDFNLSVDEYESMLNLQNNVCAICFGTSNGKRLAVDHDHKTGKIRGLLCDRCNTTLGRFDDDIKYFESMINYLLRSK